MKKRKYDKKKPENDENSLTKVENILETINNKKKLGKKFPLRI